MAGLDADTIAAIATPPGEGAIGIVRISGPRAHTVADAVFRPLHGQRPLSETPWRLRHGRVVDATGHTVDEVMAVIMAAPHTYTGEPMAEIHGHGGQAVLRAVLGTVLEAGARPAGPGEFTRRALVNGRMDLTQAEAVIDLIQARSETALRAAAAMAGGGLRRALDAIADRTTDLLAQAEAAVDFPEEDLPELITPAWFESARAVREQMTEHLTAYHAGRLFREGATIVIAGRPNAGKSTLFNRLLDEDRAIVTEIPGTTRDVLEGWTAFNGMAVRLLDTAGLRDTPEPVEREGVARARSAVAKADLVLWVLDLTLPADTLREEWAEARTAVSGQVLWVGNKVDTAKDMPNLPELEADPPGLIRVSARNGAGLEELRRQIGARLRALTGGRHPEEPMLSHEHQADSLRRALRAVEAALAQEPAIHAGSVGDIQPELLAFELREAMRALGEITGSTTPDDLLDRIFSRFCIGK